MSNSPARTSTDIVRALREQSGVIQDYLRREPNPDVAFLRLHATTLLDWVGDLEESSPR